MKSNSNSPIELSTEKPESPLTMFPVSLPRTKKAIEDIIPEVDEPGKSVVVKITVDCGSKEYKIGICHIFYKAYKFRNKRISSALIAVPTCYAEAFREDRIVQLERVTMTNKEPIISKVVVVEG